MHSVLVMGRSLILTRVSRRCEDICNCKNPSNNQHIEHKKVHCLMRIKGTVQRKLDGHFIHANIDLDIIITER